MDYEFFMEQALEQARKAFYQGQFPVGCVIVQDDQVIASGARGGTSGDLSFFSEIDHAEIRALKSLESSNIRFAPERAVLFCTMEPCLMCFAAIILAGIRTLVFAYEDVMGGGTALDRTHLTPLYRDAQITIVSHVLRKKSLDLFHNFFNKEANLYWKDSLLESYTLDQWRESGTK
ncbi:nucleoside deaminase [Desulfobacter hydrogenophilus]|uniref:Nucleoside deaminase n=1 Tax=Desulfobacter hydrogenophilus TaxID=2291 RepID=A0A328FBV7_9BACT|nr:nucleoside deaminase [Desulfobacter hydrogenophilus]NDY71967.1 nucleoside deaminase [Desulfobacter hydrogenophilus]QBH12341.1 nucleoside deaminase [Desulfobacter hydrogenophilus]RAM02058.1 nucleoside deaminase [Desulfobacter hydrogenophilus]